MKQYEVTFIDENLISTGTVKDFFRRCEEHGVEIHSFNLYRDNKLALRGAFAPYSCTDKCELYSTSKSFTSTAIGFAVAEGLLSVDDRVIDFFPTKLPPNVSDKLAAMQVRHLLTMNTGHEIEPISAFTAADSIKTFLAQPVEHQPGTHFLYNTPATYMLSAIITKLTGMTLSDYLTPRLFAPLGISDTSWQESRQGATLGGFGLRASCDDLVKLGLLYLNSGFFGDRRLLSSEWIDEATTAHSDNSKFGATPDWQAGYGYQFWRCAKGGFRGDGAFGQVCLVRPDKNIVFAILTESKDMQMEVDLMQELISRIDDRGDASADDVTNYDPSLTRALPIAKRIPRNLPGSYRASKNFMHITSYSFAAGDDHSLIFSLSDGVHNYSIKCGSGKWLESEIAIKRLAPYLIDFNSAIPDLPSRVAACYTVEKSKTIIKLRYLDRPHTHTLSATCSAVGTRVSFSCSVELINEDKKRLSGKRI